MLLRAIASLLSHKIALILISGAILLSTGVFFVSGQHFLSSSKAGSTGSGAAADTVSTDASLKSSASGGGSTTAAGDQKKPAGANTTATPSKSTTPTTTSKTTTTSGTGSATGQTQTQSGSGSSQPTTPAAPAAPMYFGMTASGVCARNGGCSNSTGLPRSDSYCAANVTATTWEPRADNYTANHTQGPADPTTVSWGGDAITNYWLNNDANVRKVDGHYTGNTTQIIQWAACKWGIDEDLIRAVAVQESDWHQSSAGDVANGCAHSFSIIQVRDSPNGVCPINHSAFGGMPYTQNSTALALDFYGAIYRTCYDGDFYDGGPWLYGGQTISQVAAAHSWDYVKWGCVGSWFSGDWYSSGAQNYINLVSNHLTNRAWEKY